MTLLNKKIQVEMITMLKRTQMQDYWRQLPLLLSLLLLAACSIISSPTSSSGSSQNGIANGATPTRQANSTATQTVPIINLTPTSTQPIINLTPTTTPTIPIINPTIPATTTAIPIISSTITATLPPCTGLSDAFNGNLSGRWQYINPTGQASYIVSGGGVTMHSTGVVSEDLNTDSGHDINGSRFLQSALGNFTMTVSLSFSPASGNGIFQAAGLLIWQDSRNFIRVEHSSGKTNMTEYNSAYGNHYNIANGVNPNQMLLRAQRFGNQVTGSYSTDGGQTWTNLATDKLDFTTSVGIELLNTKNAGGSGVAADATYQNFIFACN